MPIQVACTSCAGRFRVPDNVAGKKIRCPKCKEVIQIPAGDAATESPAPQKPTTQAAAKSAAPSSAAKPTSTTAPAKPTPAKPAAKPISDNWFLKTEDGESYGPVPRGELDSWYTEGRVTAECQVLREGSEQWQWASDLYPELDPATAAAKPTEEDPVTAPESPAASTLATTPEVKPTKPTASAEPSFVPPEEPAEASGDEANPFGFLGGNESGGGSGDFNFAVTPSSSTASSSAGKGAKKAAKTAAVAKTEPATPGETSDKSKVVAGLLALFAGGLGIHRFYLGYTTLGIVQLVLCGGCGIWALIDAILIFMGKLPDSQGRPLK